MTAFLIRILRPVIVPLIHEALDARDRKAAKATYPSIFKASDFYPPTYYPPNGGHAIRTSLDG
jgi:hypothetical protein